jgi:hypothetical protein
VQARRARGAYSKHVSTHRSIRGCCSVKLEVYRKAGLKPMSPFEVGMLACFGISWPFSIARTLRTRQVQGKSPEFLGIVAQGYGCGVAHKLLFACDWVVVLYGVNLLMVLADLSLYFRFTQARVSVPKVGVQALRREA